MFLIIINEKNNNCNKYKDKILKELNLLREISLINKCYILLEFKNLDQNISYDSVFINKLKKKIIEINEIIGRSKYVLLYFKEFMFHPDYIIVVSTNINNNLNKINNAFYYVIKLTLLRISFIVETGNVYLSLVSSEFKKIYTKCKCDKVVEEYQDKYNVMLNNDLAIVVFNYENGKSTFSIILDKILDNLIRYTQSIQTNNE